MMRTRDFALMLGTIGFLAVAIVSTVVLQGGLPGVSQLSAVFLSQSLSDSEASAVVIHNPSLSREERLEALRKKMAGLSFAAPSPEPSATSTEATTTNDAAGTTVAQDEQRCAGYRTYDGNWNPSGLTFSAVEGARLVYRVSAATASGTLLEKEVVAQLPVPSIPGSAHNCIYQDVIGIALNGSLIRNTDTALIAQTSAGTLLGYALDGFPLYGTSAANTDACGGRVVAGQYRYELHSNRNTLIACYAREPIRI